MTLSLALGHITWIDMRVKAALGLPLSVVLALGAGFFSVHSPSVLLVMMFQTGLLVCLFFTCGTDIGAWAVIPAVMAREGLFLNFMGLSSINAVLIILILMGNLLLIPKTSP